MQETARAQVTRPRLQISRGGRLYGVIILGEQLMRVNVILANRGWPEGGCGFSRSRFVFIRGSIRAGTRSRTLEPGPRPAGKIGRQGQTLRTRDK